MARLIDIDRMIDFLKKAAALEDDEATKTLDKFGVQFIERVINHYVQITEKNLGHAEDIVRCKDCVHKPYVVDVFHASYGDVPVLESDKCPCVNKDDYFYSHMPDDDWFCGNGERREAEDV